MNYRRPVVTLPPNTHPQPTPTRNPITSQQQQPHQQHTYNRQYGRTSRPVPTPTPAPISIARSTTAASTSTPTPAVKASTQASSSLKDVLGDIFHELSEHVARGSSKLAVTFDIDDTVCTVGPDGQCHPIPEMLKFYLDIKETLGDAVSIFFITARPAGPEGSNYIYTSQELVRMGFVDYTELFCFPENLYKCTTCPMFDRSTEVGMYKETIRSFLTHTGYNIIFNFGDQEWDHCGNNHVCSIRILRGESGQKATRI